MNFVVSSLPIELLSRIEMYSVSCSLYILVLYSMLSLFRVFISYHVN